MRRSQLRSSRVTCPASTPRGRAPPRQPAAAGTGGDAGAFNITAPGNATLDASLFKNFSITERFRVEFRLEAFNALNKTQLGTPDTNLQDATFGKITTSNDARRAQVSLRLHF